MRMKVARDKGFYALNAKGWKNAREYRAELMPDTLCVIRVKKYLIILTMTQFKWYPKANLCKNELADCKLEVRLYKNLKKILQKYLLKFYHN